jgi:hypothetical protein
MSECYVIVWGSVQIQNMHIIGSAFRVENMFRHAVFISQPSVIRTYTDKVDPVLS